MKKITAVFLMLMLILCASCAHKTPVKDTENAQESENAPQHGAFSPPAETHSDSEVYILAVGDNLIHSPIYKQAQRRTGGSGYDFSPAYANVAEYTSAADISIINEETPIGGAKLGVCSYPQFNSPFELGDAVYDLGFDIINLANNHAFDAGKQGVLNHLDYWKNRGVLTVGIQGKNEPSVVYTEKNGIKFAFAAYTYGSNLYIDENRDFQMAVTDTEKITADLKLARENADIVAVSFHFGNEYQTAPTQQQRQLAALAASLNADVVIGHHPHVIQPIQRIKRADGMDMYAAYSLGNFISSQNEAETQIGGMLHINVKGHSGDAQITKIGFSPIINHYEKNYANQRIFLRRDYSEELAAKHGCKNGGFSQKFADEFVGGIIDSEYLENADYFIN